MSDTIRRSNAVRFPLKELERLATEDATKVFEKKQQQTMERGVKRIGTSTEPLKPAFIRTAVQSAYEQGIADAELKSKMSRRDF